MRVEKCVLTFLIYKNWQNKLSENTFTPNFVVLLAFIGGADSFIKHISSFVTEAKSGSHSVFCETVNNAGFPQLEETVRLMAYSCEILSKKLLKSENFLWNFKERFSCQVKKLY